MSLRTEDEADLIARAKSGEEDARDYLVRRYQCLLTAIAGRRVGYDYAEDVVQNAWIKAFAALPRFEPKHPAGFRGWLCRIVINGAISWLRQNKTAPEELDGITEDTPDPTEQTEKRALDRETIAAALAKLKPKQRVMILLLARCKKKSEVAEKLGVTVRQVYTSIDAFERACGRTPKSKGAKAG